MALSMTLTGAAVRASETSLADAVTMTSCCSGPTASSILSTTRRASPTKTGGVECGAKCTAVTSTQWRPNASPLNVNVPSYLKSLSNLLSIADERHARTANASSKWIGDCSGDGGLSLSVCLRVNQG